VTSGFAGREGIQVDALVTDGYLDSLLAAHARGADHAPTTSLPADPIRSIADRLARELPRYHPSFRFEETLAARLAEVARTMRSQDLPERRLKSLPSEMGEPNDGDGSVDRIDVHLRPSLGRPLFIGSAVTSAALSLVGVAYIAWRRGRSGSTRAI